MLILTKDEWGSLLYKGDRLFKEANAMKRKGSSIVIGVLLFLTLCAVPGFAAGEKEVVYN
jgi:hypothetical protein